MKPLTDAIPKALLLVNGEPFLSHQLRLLRSRGIGNVVLCIGYLGRLIQEFVGDGTRFGMKILYSNDGDRLVGTGGAVKQAIPLLGASFLVLYGDSYLPCDYASVCKALECSGRQGLMTIFKNRGLFDKSNVEVRDGRVVRYDKRGTDPEMQYIDYGLGAFQATAFESRNAGEAFDLAEVYGELLAGGELASFEVRERFYEIGSASGLADLEDYLEAEKL